MTYKIHWYSVREDILLNALVDLEVRSISQDSLWVCKSAAEKKMWKIIDVCFNRTYECERLSSKESSNIPWNVYHKQLDWGN